MKKSKLKIAGRAGCAALALLIALSAPGSAFASASSTQKDETVYVNLDANGKTKETTVSDWLHSDDAAAQILDKSDLSNIQNVKSNETPAKSGSNLVWTLDSGSTSKTGSNIYYEGTTSKTVPLNVSITYYLNGNEISAKEIAGKSGKVKIKINIKNNDAHTVDINGKSTVMYTPMTAVLVATLPTDTFKNVTLSDGKLISDGNNQFVTFLTMPGLNDSLDIKSYDISELNDLDFPETLEITADATDFELKSMAVAATPELIDSDKLKDSDDIDKMKTNLNKLKGMQDDIEKADPDKNIRSLFTDSTKTDAARLLVDDVFDFYDMDTKLVNILPQYVTNDNIKLYDRVTSDLDKADIKYLLDNKVLRGLNDRLTDANIQKGKTLLKDYDDIETFDMTKFNRAVKVLNHYDKLYDNLDDTLDDAKRIKNHLSTSSLDTLAALCSSSVQSDLSNTMDSLNDLSALQTKAELSGISVKLSDGDIQALVECYLSRNDNLQTILGQKLKGMADKNGDITVKKLMQVMTKTGLSDETLQTAIMNQLATSFMKNNSKLTIPASALGDIKTDEVINSTILQEIVKTIKGTPGLIGTDGKIKVSTLIDAMPTLGNQLAGQLMAAGMSKSEAAAKSSAILQDLESQIMPIVLNENQKAVIPAKNVAKAVEDGITTVLSTKTTEEKAAFKEGLVKQIAPNVIPSGTANTLSSLMTNSSDLQADLKKELGSNYADRLSSAVESLSNEKKYILELKTDLENAEDDDSDDYLDDAQDLLKDKDDMDYLTNWANKIKDMKTDLDGNKETVNIMRDLLKEYDDPKIKNAKNMIPTLQSDLDDTRPILESLKDKLDQPIMNASLHKLPQTTTQLLKMKSDVENNRNIMNIFKLTTEPKTVSLFKNTFNTLDDFKKDGTIDDYVKKIDNANDLIAKKDAYVKLSDDYKIFTQSADGATTKLKFVMKTAEIKKSDTEEASETTASTQQNNQQKQEQSSSSGGFSGWVKSVWNSAAKAISNAFNSIVSFF